jgi:hypothetical protein
MYIKRVDKLEMWMEETEKLQLDEINSYLVDLRKDLDALKDSIIYSYSNGLAEWSVNKLKVIKRIMYGRNSFELFKSKLLLLDYSIKSTIVGKNLFYDYLLSRINHYMVLSRENYLI